MMQLILQIEPAVKLKKNMTSLDETSESHQVNGAVAEIQNTDSAVLKKNITASPTDIEKSVVPVKENEVDEQYVEKTKNINGIVKTNGDTQNEEILVDENKDVGKENVQNSASAINQNNENILLSETCNNHINTQVDIGKTIANNDTDQSENKYLLTEVTNNVGTENKDNLKQQIISVSLNDSEIEEHNPRIDSSENNFVSAKYSSTENGSNVDESEVCDNKIDISITNENVTETAPAFSPNSDSGEKDINITAQLKQLEDDVALREDSDLSLKLSSITEDENKTISEVNGSRNDSNLAPTIKEEDDCHVTQENKDIEVAEKPEENLVSNETVHTFTDIESDQEKIQNNCKNKTSKEQLEVTTAYVEKRADSNLPESNLNNETIDTENEKHIDDITDEASKSVNPSENNLNNKNVEKMNGEPVDSFINKENHFSNRSVDHIDEESSKSDKMEVDCDKLASVEENTEIDKKLSAANDMTEVKYTEIKSSAAKIDQQDFTQDNRGEATENSNYVQPTNTEIGSKQHNDVMDVDDTDCIAISNNQENISTIETPIPISKETETKYAETSLLAPKEITDNSSNKSSDVSTVEEFASKKDDANIDMEIDDHEVIANETKSFFTHEKALGKDAATSSEITVNEEIINIDKDDDVSNTHEPVDSKVKYVDKTEMVSSNEEKNSSANKKPTNEVEILDDEDDKFVEDKNKERDLIKDGTEKKSDTSRQDKIQEEKLPVVCKLSNMMDILSDDEDETPTVKTCEKEKIEKEENKCINIDDDDDIMIIEESNSQDSKNQSNDSQEQSDKTESQTITKEISSSKIDEIMTPVVVKKDILTDEVKETTEKSDDKEDIMSEVKDSKSQIISKTFLKTVTKNLAEMTRNELEDFCILRLVESVVDKSNLNEIKIKMKNMAQTIEELRKKAVAVTKQNRDLQVVVKTVQEDQKKRVTASMMPMKITRSVGMQVVLGGGDKSSILKKKLTMPQPAPAVTPTRPVRNVPSPKTSKAATNNIPVPRLVPASSPTLKCPNIVNSAPKPSPPAAPKNTPPVRQPEKRPHNKLSLGSSVMVDLTDDEPPAKVTQITKQAPTPPVRLVPSQNLMAPKNKPQFAPTGNSPRKVYIPISGPQSVQQAKQGQGVIKNFITPPRPRAPPAVVRMQHSVRMNQVMTHRHPAPLPDAMKQYQPPIWKSLPPAPDLKLSKVDNGIVISWKFEGYEPDQYEEVASFQLYAYQETPAPPSTALWKKIGDIKALPLPMACTLTQFMSGFKYYFAVRAIDVRSRIGPFSLPGSIMLISKNN